MNCLKSAPLLALLLVCVMAGCRPEPVQTYDIRLMAMDQVTEQYIHYISHRRLRLNAGQLGLQITLQNLHRTRNVAIDWRVIFYDKNQFRTEETEWNTLVFPPAEELVLKANSMNPAAVDFVIQLRAAQI